ncbi:hypothetical protein K4H02_25895, partial [Mycobacterium tuberculosis]|nr:hypothetical protein [Mycobacterium tuberculosis]
LHRATAYLSRANPVAIARQILKDYAGTKGYLASLEIGKVRKFLVELRAYLKTNKPQFKEIISSTKTLSRFPVWFLGRSSGW